MTLSLRAMEWLEGRRLDVELADRMGLASRGDGGNEVLIYPFVRNGRVVGRKYRPLDPKPDGRRFWRDKGDTLCAFNEDCLRDDSLLHLPLVICEGQDDCLSVIQSGHLRCISVPDGAPEKSIQDIESSTKYQWIDDIESLLALERVSEIIIASDGDEAGAALRHDLAVKLNKARCKFAIYPKTRFPEAKGRERLKDCNEVLEEYGEQGVRAVLARAEWIDSKGVYRLSELPEMPESVIYDIGFEALGGHLKLRLGDLSIWTGIGGFGKTTLLTDIMCRIVQRYGVRVGWASFEQDPQRDHRRVMRSWLHEDFESRLTHTQKWEADKWIDEHHRFLVAGDQEDADLNWLLDQMEIAVIRHGVKFIIIDPYNEIEHCRERHESEVEYTNRSVRTLRRFAKRFQIHLCIVSHPVKLPRLEDGTFMMPGLLDVNGGAVWRNKATQGIIVHRVDEDTTAIKVDKVKYAELLGTPGITYVAFNRQTRRFVETERNVSEDRLSGKRRCK